MFFRKEYHKTLISTNDTAKQYAREGREEGTVVIAGAQTGGRGRLGRSFFSPEGGVYMSLILRPAFDDYTIITPAAAAAVCRALERLGFGCRIKWVNDIYLSDKKVCGILTEADVAAGWAVLGIGINTVCPGDGAPEIAGWLYDGEADNGSVTGAVLEEFDAIYKTLPDTAFIGYYRKKSYLKDKKLLIDGKEYVYGGIGDNFALLASNGGETVRFRCGDVSVRPV